MPTTLDELPNELLILIFMKGCEDEGFISRRYDFSPKFERELVHSLNGHHEAHPRRRKVFASTVRLVCRRWQQLIDLDIPDSRHFWIAKLCIIPPQGFAIGREGMLEWTRQLIRFRQQLKKISRCSIFIHLSWWNVFDWEVYEAFNRSGASLVMRLFCHLIDFIPRTCSPIVSVTMQLNEPQILRHVLEVLPRLTTARVLSEILFYPHSFTDFEVPRSKIPYSFRELWDSAAFPESPAYNPVLSDRNFRSPVSPLQLAHFSSMDTLLVFNARWLQELHLAIQIQRLIIDDRMDILPIELLDALQANSWDCLVHLQIRCGEAYEKPYSLSTAQHSPTRRVVLPNVKSLHLVASDLWAASFLRYSSFPRLEKAIVIVNYQEDSDLKDGEMWTTTGHDLNGPIMHLSVLSINALYYSSSSLATFNYFTNSTIQTLHVVLSAWNPPLGDEVPRTANNLLSQFATSLFRLSPEVLRIEGSLNGVTDVGFLTRNLSTYKLEELVVDRNDPLALGRRSNQHVPGSACNLPALLILRWHSGIEPRGVLEFMQSLRAPILRECLFHLSYAFSDSVVRDSLSNIPVDSFLSVTKLTLILDLREFPEARWFWETFPNVRSFHLDVLFGSLPHPSKLVSQYYQMTKFIIQNLTPRAVVPFRDLHLFTFTIVEYLDPGETKVAELTTLLEAVFDARNRAGAEAIKVEFLGAVRSDVSGRTWIGKSVPRGLRPDPVKGHGRFLTGVRLRS